MKEGDSTEKFVESLVKELNCETVFTIPVFGGIAVDEGVVVTWIIMASYYSQYSIRKESKYRETGERYSLCWNQ